jgi:hypothetical protein
MTEDEFFGNLEMRLCREFYGMRERELRGFWCDGFMPEREFIVAGDKCQITGRVWIAHGGKSQGCWDFALLLGSAVSGRENVDWEATMPGEDVTGWLAMDFQNRLLKINPSAAHADQLPAAK